MSSSDSLLGVVEKVETKVKDTSTHVLAINSNVRLIQVPSTSAGIDEKNQQESKMTACRAAISPDKQLSNLVIELVLLAVGTLERDLTTNSVVHVDLSIEIVLPGGRIRVYQKAETAERSALCSIERYI